MADNNSIVIDQVIDNLDNSLTITAHSGDTIYTTGMGRKSDLPEVAADQMAYYQQVIADNCIPDGPVPLYTAPGYTPPDTNEAE